MQPVEDENRARSGADNPAARKQARTGLILLTALIVEVVAIGGGLNQTVSGHITNTANSHSGAVRYGWLSLLTYTWSFTRRSADHSHVWVGQFALIGTTIVLSLLLILAVLRGPVTWGRAFFGTWMAVIVATLAGRYVYALIVDPSAPGQGSRVVRTLFGAASPSSQTVLAGAALGLLTAVIVSIVAIATRRAPAVPEAAANRPAESIFTAGQDGRDVPAPGAGWTNSGWTGGQTAPAPPPWGQDAQHTSRLPSMSKQDAAHDSPSDPETKAGVGAVGAGGSGGETTNVAREHPVDEQPVDEQPVDEQPVDEQPAAAHAASDQPTTAPVATPDDREMPAAEPDDTRAMPAASEPDQTQAMPAQRGATAFPRPPDDEDLQPPHEHN